jgi:hypothetical protein
VRLRDVPREREQQRERVLRRRDHVRLRRVGDHDPALGRGPDVDVVDPDARAADRAQPLGAPDQVGGQLRRRADQDAVELADPALELAVLPVDAELDVEAGVAKQLNSGVPDLLLDENPGGVGHEETPTLTPASRKTVWAAPTPAPSSTSCPSSRSVISSAATVVTTSKAPK